jgi:PAS domain S-box-containing protein
MTDTPGSANNARVLATIEALQQRVAMLQQQANVHIEQLPADVPELLDEMQRVLDDFAFTVEEAAEPDKPGEKPSPCAELLRQSHENLELRVQDRTAKLFAANAALQREMSYRRRVEEELRASQELLQAVIDHAPAAIFVKDLDGRLMLVNQQSAAFMQSSAAEMLGKYEAQVFPPHKVAMWKQSDERVLASGEVVTYEDVIARDDGDAVYLSVKFPIRNAQGEIYAIGGIAADITRRKQMERTMREHNALLQKVLANLPVVLYVEEIHDAEKSAAHQSPAVTLLPHTRASSVRTREDEALLQQMCTTCQSVDDLVVQSGEAIETEEVLPYRGQPHTFLSIKLPLYDEWSNLYAIGGILIDITERKHMEEALRSAQHELEARVAERTAELAEANRALQAEIAEHQRTEEALLLTQFSLDHAADGVAWYNQYGEHIYVNEAACRVPGFTREELLNMTVMALDPEMDAERWAERCALFRQQRSLSYITRHHRKDGGTFPVEVTMNYLQYRGQEYFCSFIRDITERKRVEAELAQERQLLAQRVDERTAELSRTNAELARAMRTKDEFLATMSHELRTPLNAILGLSESLMEQVYGPLNEKQLKTLGTIERSGRHLLTLINDILDLSKIEAGKMDLHYSPVFLETVCQASLLFVRQQAFKKKVDVTFTIDEALTTMQADERRLKQILINLLTNAVKFTPEGGKVGLEVRGEADEDIVVFTVWDTGIGIAPEAQKRLFQPFVQIDSGLARQHGGTGLGLALVARLTEIHGGSVQIESEEGMGSRFTVQLPQVPQMTTGAQTAEHEAAQQEEEPPQQAQAVTIGEDGSCRTILLAEDNEATIQLLSEYLAARGYRVVLARNGLEAIERTREERPALILMDIQMPGMDGLEATRLLRTDSTLASLPIIALTALAMHGDRERCLAAGVDEYLSKPVRLRSLMEVIESFLVRDGSVDR